MWRDAFGDTYFIKIFLKIVWGCSQDTSHDRNNCCIDIPQFLPFYPELQVLVYLFRAPWGKCFNLLVLPHLSSNSFLPLVNTMSNCLASITLSVLILKPYWSLHLSIHSRASGIYLYVPAGFNSPATFNTVHFTKTREVFLLLCHVLSKIDFLLNLYKQPQYRWDTFCLFLA